MIALASADRVTSAFDAGLRPDPLQTLSEWSDENMILPSYSSERGPFRTSRVPFLKEIMDCLSPSHPCQEVVFMKCVQIAGTQTAVNWASFVIDRVPASMMLVEPTVDLAMKLSKTKIQQALDDVACLRDKVKTARSRDSGNTILMKEFTGGMLVFAGANSGVSLRFLPARFLFLDEIDAYPQDVDGEGHPVELAENRTSSFARCKIFKNSTPLTKELSVIEPAYLNGSRGHYHVPCPFCLHMQWLQWKNFIFTVDGVTDPKNAAYRCENAACGKLIQEHHKPFMLENGQWVHEDPENPVRSFHINILYQPYGWKLSWEVLAKQWLKASKRASRGDTRALKVFINTYLAQT
ncbi:MAG: terminase gpA endonuclease subunit, partial [Nitrosomonas ureae]